MTIFNIDNQTQDYDEDRITENKAVVKRYALSLDLP